MFASYFSRFLAWIRVFRPDPDLKLATGFIQTYHCNHCKQCCGSESYFFWSLEYGSAFIKKIISSGIKNGSGSYSTKSRQSHHYFNILSTIMQTLLKITIHLMNFNIMKSSKFLGFCKIGSGSAFSKNNGSARLWLQMVLMMM